MGLSRCSRGMVLSMATKLGLILASSALPLAKAAGSSSGPSLLETPTFTLAGVLFFFLLISLLFERSTHLLVWFFQKHNRQGLATAVQNLVTELTLIGFISLVLIVFQGKIHEICVPYSPDTYVNWMLLHNVDGCDCCLADTSEVGYCFQNARDCGVDYCNCGGVDNCEAGEGLRRLLAGSTESEGGGTSVCYGNSAMEIEPQTCSDGKAPLVSLTALHEVHLLIFAVAVGHVSLGVVMILLADLRMSLWRKWAQEEDEHAQQVRKHLDTQSAGPRQPARKQLASRFASFRSFMVGRVHREAAKGGSPTGGGGGGSGGASPAKPSSPSWGGVVQRWATFSGATRHPRAAGAPEPAGSAGGGDGAGTVELPTGTRTALAAKREVRMVGAPSESATGSPSAEGNSPTVQPTLRTIASAASLHEAELGKPATGWQSSPSVRQQQSGDSVAGTKGLGEIDVVTEEGSSSSSRSGSKQAGGGSEAAVPSQQAAAELAGDVAVAGSSGPSLSKASVAVKKILRRQGTITTRHGWVYEWAMCFLIQLLPSPLSKDDFLIMRASFMLTHRVPKTFDFMTYIQNSMEDDLADIVGVSVEMWLTIVIFVLISGLIGWPVLIFLVLAALIQTVTDTKLVQIMRHVCRGGRVNRLASNIFWRQKPPLLLIPIKFMLFFCSFIFSTTVFFAAVYGPNSCPLGGAGFWFAWSHAKWWISLIVAGYLLFTLSFKTLPLYSLCVQMGSDFKSSMLPTRVREKLLFIAQHIKEKRRQQELAERQAAGGGSSHGLEGVQRAAAAVRDAGILLLSREPPKH